MSIESFIIDGARSPIGTKNGQMVGVRSDDLAAQVIQGLMQRNANIPAEVMEDVIKISDEHKLKVMTESFPLEQANEVLAKLKNSEIDARAVLIP